MPTAVTLAARDAYGAEALAAAFAAPWFRLYHSADIRGVEVGGSVKNVLAIASGIAAGRGLGRSAGAALIARGFAELTRFGMAYGADPGTLMGLAGLGDLVLTCGSTQSRNYSFGVALGQGMSVDDATAQGGTVEGAQDVRHPRGACRTQRRGHADRAGRRSRLDRSGKRRGDHLRASGPAGQGRDTVLEERAWRIG